VEAQLCGDEDVIVVGGGQLGWTSGGVSFANRGQGSHVGAGWKAIGYHVALSDPAH
jgi:hypothetical protein